MKLTLHSRIAATVLAAALASSCSKEEVVTEIETNEFSLEYRGERAIDERDKTIVELLAVKDGVRQTINLNQKAESLDQLVSDLESFRPRLEYIHLQTSLLPESEQMVIRGNLAVAINDLEDDLLAVLAQSPGNDDLAVEIAHLREQLSPLHRKTAMAGSQQ